MAGRPYGRRLNDLEERFRGLAPELPEGPAKEAFSVLHGMIQELWRSIGGAAPAPADGRRSLTLEDIANLYRTASAMSGERGTSRYRLARRLRTSRPRTRTGRRSRYRSSAAARSSSPSTRSTEARRARTSCYSTRPSSRSSSGTERGS